MVVKHLFRRLRENNIDISLNGNNLQINSDQPEIPLVLFEEIKLNKEEIIRYLNSNNFNVPEFKSISKVATIQENYAISPSQRRLWILSQFEDGKIAYNMPGCYVFEGNLDFEALRRC